MEINICLATNDHYAPHAAVLMTSIMTNKSHDDELYFHFFSDNTSSLVQDMFHQMSHKMGFKLTIYEMSDEQFVDFPTLFGCRTTYFRISMHRMLPNSLTKILYLDCDMIVTSSLKELFSMDVSEHYAAVVASQSKVPHLPIEYPYFNAGMILFNLEKYRNDKIEVHAVQFGYEHLDWLSLHDQDILNYIFSGNVIYLPLKWNMMLDKAHREEILVKNYVIYPYSDKEIHEAENNPAIIHYVTERKPWFPRCQHPHKASYWTYAKKTPFYRQACHKYYMALLLLVFVHSKELIKLPERLLRQWIVKPIKRMLKAS